MANNSNNSLQRNLIRLPTLEFPNTAMQTDEPPLNVFTQQSNSTTTSGNYFEQQRTSSNTTDPNAILKQILDKVNETDNRFASFENKFSAVDETLSDLVRSQTAINNNLTEKLDIFMKDVCEKLNDHSNRLTQLEKQVASKPPQPQSSTSNQSSSSGDIIISGIPVTIDDTPEIITDKVFSALRIRHLLTDILEIRVANRKSDSQIFDPNTLARPSKKSIIVTLKSSLVRDHVLKKKRQTKKVLTLNEVFSCDLPGNVTVNEIYDSQFYNLLCRTRARARLTSYKHVWVYSGNIVARKDFGSPIIEIKSAKDLEKLI